MNARRRQTRAAITSATRSSDPLRWQHPAILIGACLATYWNSLRAPFVLDDVGTIANNSSVPTWSHLLGLSPQNASAVGGRPVAQLSLAFNRALGGVDVLGYHVWNLAVHVACALLLFGLLRRTLGQPGIQERFSKHAGSLAFAAALIWAVHPLNSEVVDYVVQRTESMVGLCYLATLYASVRAVSSASAATWSGTAVAACAVGMGCKESMVSAPLMVVLYDSVFTYGSIGRALAQRKRLYAALAATWLLLAALIWSAPRSETAGFSSGISPWTYLLNQTILITRYLELTVWPRALVAFYGWPRPLALADVLPYAALVVALCVAAGLALVFRPRLGFLGLWFFVTLAPTSSIIPIATEVGAERRMYLPLMALVVILLLGVVRLADAVRPRSPWAAAGYPRWGPGVILAMVVTLLGVQTAIRNREYSSTLSLARTIVARWPTGVARQILGEELIATGDHEEAIMQLRMAAPDDSMARYPLGLLLFSLGRWSEAVDELGRFVQTWRLPYRLVPHWLEPTAAEVLDARTTMARALANLERWPAVIEEARRILQLNPVSAEGFELLGNAYLTEQRFDEAAASYRQYVQLRPNAPEPQMGLGMALLGSNKPEESVAAFRRAVDLAPGLWQAQRNLANALFDTRDAEGAALHAREAIRLKPDDAGAHDLLGRALAVQGKIDEAIAEFTRAIELDPRDEQAREDLQRIARLKNR